MIGLKKIGGISAQGTRHSKYEVYVDGALIKAFPIPSDNSYGDTLIGFVANPLCMRNKQFYDVCKCTKDLDWYRNHLKALGKL